MKKVLGVCLVGLLALALVAPPAGAFTFQVGNNIGEMVDVGSFFAEYVTNHPGLDPLPLAQPTFTGTGTPTYGVFYDTWNLVGAEDRTLISVGGLWEPPIQSIVNQYYFGGAPGEPELTGLAYDLVVTSVAITAPGVYVVKLGPGSRYDQAGYSGRVDVYEDSSKDATTLGNGGRPWDWVEGGAADSFPTYDDGSLLISGRFLPIDTDGTVLALSLNYNTGQGEVWDGLGNGIIKVLVNNSSTPFLPQYMAADGTLGEITFNNRFDFYPDADVAPRLDSVPGGYGDIDDPRTTDVIYWATASNDPFSFTALPEPGSLALMGIGLVGLAGQLLRRRRK